MKELAALPCPPAARPVSVVLLLCVLGLGPRPAAALDSPLEVERVELSVRLDPPLQALYAQAHFLLRQHGLPGRDVIAFRVPAAVGPRLHVAAVWDDQGELPWRFDAEKAGPWALRVELRSPLRLGKRMVVVVNYELELGGAGLPEGAAVSEESALLLTTGWYPFPAGPNQRLPRELRLTARLPKQWQVEAPVKVKKLNDGTALASYELRLRPVEPGQLLLRARRPLPP